MKQTSLLSLSALLVTMIPPIVAAQIHLTATLNGGQEVPPLVTPATGSGSFELSGDLTELRYFVSYQGITASDGGFHAGGTGTNGTLIRSLTIPTSASGTFSGIWRSDDAVPLTPAFVDSLLTGRMYIELNTADRVVTGVIRGQIELSTSLHFEAVFEGVQENPPVPTTAGGTGVFVLDKTRAQLDYRVTYRGLTGALSSGGEIRAGAAGSTDPVVRTIAAAGDPPSATIRGTWRSTDVQPLTRALVDSLIAGRMYSNFSTETNQGGEIRGQVSRDFDVLTSIRELSRRAPGEFRLAQNYPNPFNPSTTIRFQLIHASNVDLAIYNALGQKVATLFNGEKPAGVFAVKFNSSGLCSGVYSCRLQTGGGCSDEKVGPHKIVPAFSSQFKRRRYSGEGDRSSRCS